MRTLADRRRIEEFMELLGRQTVEETHLYFTGGATAVLYGWRSSTVDVDIKLEPERDAIFRLLPGIKERLRLNIELASPVDFIPVRDGWQSRSPFIGQVDHVFFHHFDLYAQALAKIERAHEQDIEDVRAMLCLGLIERQQLTDYFSAIESLIHRYPALDRGSFQRAVEAFVKDSG